MSSARRTSWDLELTSRESTNAIRRCEACGEVTRAGALCGECHERSRPHVEGDPYDDLGGEQGLGG